MKVKTNKEQFEIEVSRTGTFTPMKGPDVTITREMLVDMAANYDPMISEAPFVIGHPTINDPAYGQVEKFEVTDDDRLVACGEKETIDPWFKKMVGKKAFNKVSLAFFPPTATSNPKPGTWYPKQVGCLGAQPPAVPNLTPGLQQLAFSEDPDLDYSDVIECSYAVDHVIPNLFRRFRDWLIDTEGKEVADEVLPAWEIATLEEEGVRNQTKDNLAADQATGQSDTAAAFSEPLQDNNDMSDKELLAANAKIKKLEAENAIKQTAIDANTIALRATRNSGIKEFCDGLVSDEKCMPETASKLGAVLRSLPGDQAVAFSEGGDAQDLGEAIQDIVNAISTESFDFAEKTKDDTVEGKVLSFAAPVGVQVDQKRDAIANQARALAKEEGITFIEACGRLGV